MSSDIITSWLRPDYLRQNLCLILRMNSPCQCNRNTFVVWSRPAEAPRRSKGSSNQHVSKQAQRTRRPITHAPTVSTGIRHRADHPICGPRGHFAVLQRLPGTCNPSGNHQRLDTCNGTVLDRVRSFSTGQWTSPSSYATRILPPDV